MPAAEPLRDNFERFEPAWVVDLSDPAQQSIRSERSDVVGRNGGGEVIRMESSQAGLPTRLVYSVPASRVLDELTASVWVRSPSPGWILGIGIIVPGVIDPDTKQPVEIIISGSVLQETDRWSELTCRTSDREVRGHLVRLRAKYPDIANFGQLYVDRLYLACRAPAGSTQIAIDDLEMKPIVPIEIERPATLETPALSNVPQVEFRLDRLLVDGRPFFPRMVRYHGEPPELLRDLGFNTVFIDQADDTALIQKLWSKGLWVTATPPRPADDQGQPLESSSAGLVPFTPDVDPVLFWMLGTRVHGDQREAYTHWIEQLEFADRRRVRPLALDVASDERLFSRDIELLGISRHPLQTTLTLDDYRRWLLDRKSQARPGAFCWTWLQVEPSPQVQSTLTASGATPLLEPEQIRLQAYAAIVAGMRGLGFWTSTSLAEDSPFAEERRQAIKRVNLELQLLEPWLAHAGNFEAITCQVKGATSTNFARNLPFGLNLPNVVERDAQLRSRSQQSRQLAGRDQELSAYVLRTEHGLLVLPLWLEGESQWVPAQCAVSDVTLIVPGCEQTAEVVEFTPTHLHRLQSSPAAGGKRIELPRLDEVGFIWVTSELSKIQRMRDRITGIQAIAAKNMVQLANLKLDRVGLVDQQLQPIAPAQPDAPQLLGGAKLRVDQATSALSQGDFRSAEDLAGQACQQLRILQRSHWDAAVDSLSSPVSSPYTLCYQTLPDHWRLISTFGTSRQLNSRNLLPSGEFEDFATMTAEKWQNVHRAPEILQTSAALFPTGRKKGYALRLECRPHPGVTSVLLLEESPVTVTTPPMPVRAGQILHISGWVKLTEPVKSSRDGVLIYDSLLGRSAGLRVYDAEQWTRFELLRIVPASGEFTVSFSLTGLGEVLLDDLQVIPHDPHRNGGEDATSTGVIQQTKGESPSGSGLFSKWPRLPRMTPRGE
ncbi:hypothetical protein GC163_10745 [bacterium]|nr:hypothetical protein [bacterium]